MNIPESKKNASTVRVQCECSASTVRVQCEHIASTVRVQCEYSASTVWVQCEYSASTVQVQCEYSASTVTSKVISSLALDGQLSMTKYRNLTDKTSKSSTLKNNLSLQQLLYQFLVDISLSSGRWKSCSISCSLTGKAGVLVAVHMFCHPSIALVPALSLCGQSVQLHICHYCVCGPSTPTQPTDRWTNWSQATSGQLGAFFCTNSIVLVLISMFWYPSFSSVSSLLYNK